MAVPIAHIMAKAGWSPLPKIMIRRSFQIVTHFKKLYCTSNQTLSGKMSLLQHNPPQMGTALSWCRDLCAPVTWRARQEGALAPALPFRGGEGYPC
ncbi:hypothetical protein E2C01_079262 [Portunus trituberculatus]|uniref:Uncharacterized protein n=1 Tax=Portunus trituberculatus TaxID=210409 RepID=A0A5B7IQ56_PORTR|nr:hypothetical protein [Portunus trituberculatus]